VKRREKARLAKKKQRERRLRALRHEVQSRPGEDVGDDEPGPDADDGEPALGASAAADNADSEVDGSDVDVRPHEPTLHEALHLNAHLEERLQRRIMRVLDAVTPATDEALAAAGKALAGKTLEELDAAFGEDPIERAQDLAFEAWDAEDIEDAKRLADDALDLDPDCTDALALLASLEVRETDRLTGLQGVIDDAAKALGGDEAIAQRGDDVWADAAARPYLRARHILMRELLATGRTDRGIEEAEALLALDAEDHQSVSSHLAGALLEQDELKRARQLLERFELARSPDLLWARVLERFLAGDRREASGLRMIGCRMYPGVEELILGTNRSADQDDLEAAYREFVAHETYEPLARAWARHREARRWLADGAPSTTAAERRAALKTYAPPVAALLRLGEPVFGGPGQDLSRWVNYPAVHQFRAAHVADLLRMADDAALYEADADRSEVWASVHAWRALALMAFRGITPAEAVADILLRRSEERPDDDWTTDDAVHVLGLIGAPALHELTEIVRYPNRLAGLRTTAACALAEIGEWHPALREEVIGTLCFTLRDVVENVEEGLRDDVDTDIQDGEFDVMDMVACGLISLHAGTGAGGAERIALIERALDAEVIDEKVCGARELILAGLRGKDSRERNAGAAGDV